LTSTFATVSTDIPSYEAIHGRMPLHYYRSYNFRYVSHTGFHQSPLSDASRHAIYVRDIIQIWEHWLHQRKANRSGTRPDTYGRDILRTWDIRIADTKQMPTSQETRQRPSQSQRIHHTRTRRLSIAASMIFDKLPSNWVNWWLQGRLQERFQSPCVYKSRVTGNAEAGPFPRDFFDPYPTSAIEAGHSPEAVYELRAIHVDPHHRRQLKSRLPSTRLDGVIYATEAAKSVNGHIPRTKSTYEGSGWIYAIRTIHI